MILNNWLFFLYLMLCQCVEIFSGPTTSNSKSQKKTEDRKYWASMAKDDILKKLSQIPNMNKVKNVIIIIGDGMGINTITPARIYKGQKNGKFGEEETLSWEDFPYTGLIKTYNTDYQVPDSAGTATAILSGTKTKMGVLGLDNSIEYNKCDLKKNEAARLDNIFQMAIRNNKETGIVTTTRLTHATPGAGYAFVANRDWESDADMPEEIASAGCIDIAKQLIYNRPGKDINVLFGGGRARFTKSEDGGKRKDEDLISAWKNMKKNVSSNYLNSSKDLKEWNENKTKYVLGLFGDSHLPYQDERDPEVDPSFSDMALAAFDRLQSAYNDGKSDGFVLLLESGRIDHAHHDNFARRAYEELFEMDRAIQHIKEKANLEDTLIIVTADHSHSVTMNGYPKRGNSILGYIFEERGGNFVKLPDGTKIPYSTISYASGLGYLDHNKNGTMVDVRTMDYKSYSYRSPTMRKASSETHGGEDVAIYAIGPQSHLFTGVHEQNFIAHGINYGMCQISDIDAPFCSSSYKPNSLNPLTLLLIVLFLISLR